MLKSFVWEMMFFISSQTNFFDDDENYLNSLFLNIQIPIFHHQTTTTSTTTTSKAKQLKHSKQPNIIIFLKMLTSSVNKVYFIIAIIIFLMQVSQVESLPLKPFSSVVASQSWVTLFNKTSSILPFLLIRRYFMRTTAFYQQSNVMINQVKHHLSVNQKRLATAVAQVCGYAEHTQVFIQ